MEDAEPSGCNGRRRLKGVRAFPCRLAADEPDISIFNKVVKTADGIRAAAYTSNHSIGKSPFLLLYLLPDLPGNRVR